MTKLVRSNILDPFILVLLIPHSSLCRLFPVPKMMSLLRTSAKSIRPIQLGLGNQGLSSLLRDTPRRFATEAEAPPPAAAPPQMPQRGNVPPRPVLNFEPNGKVYGKISSIGRFATKSDIIAMMRDSNLTLEDIKFFYGGNFNGNAAVIQFSSQAAYSAAVRAVSPKTPRQGGLFKVDRMTWENLKSYDGKSILLQGIPSNAQMDDVERFLSEYQINLSSIFMFSRWMQPRSGEDQDAVRMAIVNFPSRALASHAFITKNKGFCRNSQIDIRVLQ